MEEKNTKNQNNLGILEFKNKKDCSTTFDNFDLGYENKDHQNTEVLCRFMKKFEYLKEALQNKSFYARVSEERLGFVHPIFNICYIPMVCFCDISLSNIKTHMENYGEYGIVMKKEWGIKNKLQPVMYINPKCFEFKDEIENLLFRKNIQEKANGFFSTIFYMKPHNANCCYDYFKYDYMEEKEWRFIPYKFLSSFQHHCFMDCKDFWNNNYKQALPFNPDKDVAYLFVKTQEEKQALLDLDDFKLIVGNIPIFTSEDLKNF